MKNYKTDDSLFTDIVYPANYGNTDVVDWIQRNDIAMMRYIQDQEADADFLTLDQKLDIYPGIKTFAVIASPWERMAYAYMSIVDELSLTGVRMPNTEHLNIDTFEDFIFSLDDTPLGNYSFSIIKPVKTWLSSNVNQLDYIFRYSNFYEDFKVFQEYFDSEDPLIIEKPFDPEWKSLYNKKTENRIFEIFKQDIDYFNFSF